MAARGRERWLKGSRGLAAAIWAAILLSCLGLFAFTASMAWQSRERALSDAATRTATMAQLLERHVASVVETAELLMHGVGKEWTGRAPSSEAHARAASFLAGVAARHVRNGALAAVRDVHVLDGSTGARMFPVEGPIGDGRSVAAAAIDADAARAHAGSESAALHIGAPVREVAEGVERWSLGLSRRALDENGRLGPVVVVHLSLHALRGAYDALGDIGRFGTIKLLRTDGQLLVRRPRMRDLIGADLSRTPLFTEHLGRSPVGGYEARAAADGVERLVSYRRLPGTPLVLAVALSKEEALAPWRRGALQDAGHALAAALGIVLLGGWLAKETTRRSRTEAELAAQAGALRSTLETMDQGLLMVDPRGVVQICNHRATELLGLTPDLMARRPSFASVIDHQIASGEFDGGEAEELRAAIGGGGGVLALRPVYERTRPNGVVLEVRTVAVGDGGAVRTFTDVTARRAIESQLRDQNRRFDAALETMGQGLVMIDGRRRLTVVNQRLLDLYGLSAEVVHAGVPARTLVEHSVERGNHAPGITGETAWAVWVARLAANAPVNYNHKLPDGRWIEIDCTPAEDGGWVITHEDVTERVDAHEALRRQNVLFDAALANMAHGLCMFDAQSRLVVRNERYLQMCGVDAAQVPLGIAQGALVDRLVELGLYPPGATADSIRESTRVKLATRDESAIYRELSDGRIIAVSHHVMAGGGWVATFDDVTASRRAEARMAHMARHDALTGLPNRLELRERMEEALARGGGEPGSAAVLCLDLDRFKAVNDQLGHPVGDALLREVAARIRAILGGAGLVARLGGDEFAILHAGDGERSAAEAASGLAARLVDELALPFAVDGPQLVVGASVGIAVAPADGSDPDTLLRNADMALYRAKADGRGAYRAFEPSMDEWARSRRALEVELRGALAEKEFELHYQPLLALASDSAGRDRVSGFEALLRWPRPGRPAVSPAEFIPIAEEIGLIVPLGSWVLRRACLDAAAHWPDDVGVAVNLSAVQFRRGERLDEVVFSALAASGLRPGRLELEITESVLLEDTDATLATLHQLRSFGVRVALDDFGTGYSSLSYLRKFPFDKIKIDRSFVREIADGSGSAGAIVRAVAALAASLGMTTTAEGVETDAQLAAVRAEGCSEAQGFLFSPPRPLAAATASLRDIGSRRRAA